MRTIVGIALLVIGLGLLLGQVEGVAVEASSEVRDVDWVRTAQGWERADHWGTTPITAPRLHPLVVAAGQGLVSLLALGVSTSGRPVDFQRLWLMAWTGR